MAEITDYPSDIAHAAMYAVEIKPKEDIDAYMARVYPVADALYTERQASAKIAAEAGASLGEAAVGQYAAKAILKHRQGFATPERPAPFTTGHCENKAQPGGCQLHNLQCAYPDCDRRPTERQVYDATR